MKVVLHNLYYPHSGYTSYFRKLGDGFDFVNDPKYASDLTKQECDSIMEHEKWYCNMYSASHMTVEGETPK